MKLDVTLIGCYSSEQGIIEKEKDFLRMGPADSPEEFAGRIARSVIGVKGSDSIKVKIMTRRCRLVCTFSSVESENREYIEKDILRKLNDIQEKEASASSR